MEKKKKKDVKIEKELIALKDFVIFQNGERYEIKKDEVVKVPKRFLQNLITEKVI